MTSIRRILAPVDLSETSLRALAAARDLASRWNATVRALNCFDTSAALAQATWIGDGIGTVIEELDQATATEFAGAMELFDWRCVTHEILHVEGDPVATIVEQASSCDLIVMGTHGIKNVAAELIGSVVYSVIKRSTRPVLAVHAGDRPIAGYEDREDAAAAPKLVKSN
jgi:nucleotide-binding universal stress UspA family protein